MQLVSVYPQKDVLCINLWCSLCDCARGIINAGISRIFVTRAQGPSSQKWHDSAERSMDMFDEAGVEVRWYDVETFGI